MTNNNNNNNNTVTSRSSGAIAIDETAKDGDGVSPAPESEIDQDTERTLLIKKKDDAKNLRKKPSNKCPVILLVIGSFLAILGVVMFPVMDKFIRSQIEKKVIISNSSDIYDIWQNIPVPVFMQFYVFNVENEEEILAGGKPTVTQHGPYTYRERRVKFDIVWNPNGTVTYRQNKTYQFIPEKSSGKETDRFVTINPLMATVVQAIKWLPEWLRVIVATVITGTGADGLFMNRTVNEILWGYDDPTLVTLNKIVPLWFFSTNIGYFIRRNFTDDGLYTVYTGEKDITKLGHIDKYNGGIYLGNWTTPWADMVNGSDGSVDAPFQFNKMVQQAFVSQICRSVNGYYRGMVDSPQGIPLRRFTGDQYTFANPSANPENIGFCTPQSRCLPSGLLNSTLCQQPVDYFRIPAIMSFPHYLYADTDVQNSVDGMAPNKEEHETIIDVEPWTGMVLRVASRVQINFFVEKVPMIGQTQNIRTLYFPILWLNESAVTDKEHEDMLLNELFLPMTILTVVKVAFISGGLLLCVIVIVVLAKRARQETLALRRDSRQDSKTDKYGGIPRPSYDTNPNYVSDANSSLPKTAGVDRNDSHSQNGNGRLEKVATGSHSSTSSYGEKNYLITPP